MDRTLIVDALEKGAVGDRIKVQGWVRTRRDSKAGLSFIHLNDGTTFDNLQLVAPAALENYEDTVLRLTTGSSVTAVGELVESQGKGQRVEVQLESIELLGDVDDPDTYPVSPKRHTFEYLRTVAHLRTRTNTFGAVARMRHTLAMAVHRFFDERRFLYVHTPIITASDTEGAGELFRVSTLDLVNLPRTPDGAIDFNEDFFGREAYLTVSGQLPVESYCCALSNVYTFGPTFRAEDSNTSRHLAEFWMIEPEIAFADLGDNIDLAEAFIRYLCRAALDERPDDMAFFNERIEKGVIDAIERVANADFERITYTEAVERLAKSKKSFEYPVEWGLNLQAEHERYLTEEVFKKPVTVTDYPKKVKAFYMRENEDGKTVAAMDMLVPRIGEIIGGSQREERLEVLDRRIEEMNLDPAPYWWYRDLRRYGTVPHAGFGLGFERLMLFITGMQNIRDVIPFPRAPRQAEF
ncbi:MAG: asparagine--tRNA ligase [Phycisphaerales bacterium]